MAKTHFEQHPSHHGSIHLTKNLTPHYAALRCVECNKHIQWVNRTQVSALEQIGVPVKNRNIDVMELF